MHLRTLAATAVAASLALAGTAQAATVPVQSLTAPFNASNSTVTKTPDGVHFGTYADGGAIGGSLTYSGFNGHRLDQITDFSYTFTYREAGVTTGAAPYARVFLDADSDGIADNDVIFDPSLCATTRPDTSTDLTFQMIGNSVRYSDDGCDGVAPDNQPWATVLAAHGAETVVGLLVSQGNSTGTDVSALLRQITVNGTTFAFNVPPANGDAGAPGAPGAVGVGQPGINGANGANGANGVTTTVTRIVQEPVSAPSVCTAGKRVLHASKRKGERFLSATAQVRGKRLPVKGRTITLNLAGQTEGNFNVQIRARYRTHSGKVRVVKSTRTLSVACS